MADPTAGGTSAAWSDLALRIASGVAMAAVALVAAWWGGWPFALFWTLAAIAVLSEWLAMVAGAPPRPALVLGGMVLLAAMVAALVDRPIVALIIPAAGALALLPLLRAARAPGLSAFGMVYAGAISVPIILLRGAGGEGVGAVLFLFAVVWGSDIMAYFCGRSFGGPKLWPRISPKKTWSGFVGGTLSGAAAGTVVAALFGHEPKPALFVLALALGIVSQGGDLFESSIKRRFGTKDASRLIPGHGGVMDRLDGFVAAAFIALIVAAARDSGSLPSGLLAF